MTRWTGLLGLILCFALAWALSSRRREIPWRTIGWAMALQWILALVVLRGEAIAGLLHFIPWPRHGGWLFLGLAAAPVAAPGTFRRTWAKAALGTVIALVLLRGNLVGQAMLGARATAQALMDCAQVGSAFVFGPLASPTGGMGAIFAFLVLPTIIFISAIFAALYHLGLMQRIVRGFSRALRGFLDMSGAEGLTVSASILMGQTEAPLTIRPYLAGLTRAELMLMMTAGMAHVSGSIILAYHQVGNVDVGHLLTAVLMTTPGAVLVARLMEPETETAVTGGGHAEIPPSGDVNVLDATARGASEGLRLALNVAGVLVAFIALVALGNRMLGAALPGWSLERIMGLLLRPLAFSLGVPWKEAADVGSLLGQRLVVNEFVAYIRLGQLPALSMKARGIATFALCGFANFSSIAIQVGGIGALVPERRGDLARLGLRALVAGSLANFMAASIAGILL